MSKLEELVRKRGYIKGAITRLLAVIEEDDLLAYTAEMLSVKKARCITAFEAYEKMNESILCLDPDDDEDVGAYEHNHMAQAFQLERDSKVEPKVEDFIGYLEKRALAMENAEPIRDKSAPAYKPVNTLAKEKQGCQYCVATDSGAEPRRLPRLRAHGAAPECRAPAEYRAAAECRVATAAA